MNNIDKSGFRKGEYVGYTQRGAVRIRKVGAQWRATITQADNSTKQLLTSTLAAMSKVLANY